MKDDPRGCPPYLGAPPEALQRLIEPAGLLHGEAAGSACAAGLALRLAGGPLAFSMAVLLDAGHRRLMPVGDIPTDWSVTLDRVTRRPGFAGLPSGPLVMGILNATPDSFSDGGLHRTAPAAIEAGLAMSCAGAGVIDVGGESTRPGAMPVSPDEEQARILPVVEGLASRGIAVSVDTRHADTMRAALRLGALLVNDVSALSHDDASRGVVAEAGCPVVLMHSRGTPQTMHRLAEYDDVAVAVVRELSWSIDAAERAGIGRDRMLVDPGIGFAKTEAQSLRLLARLPILANLGCRVVLGVSRKGFIGRIGGGQRADGRLAGSIVAALPGLSLGDVVLRVHDVAETVQAVRLWQAIHR